MALPKYYGFYGPFLKMIKDGQIHDIKEIRQGIVQMLNLTNEDITDRLPSGKQSILDNRIGWAKTYLKKAGLVDNPLRGRYILTEEGKKALPDADIIDDNYLKRYKSFREFTSSEEIITNTNEAVNKSPEEILEDSFKTLNDSLAQDLMTEIMKLSPIDFEHLVVKLLLKMGYGSGIDTDALVTQASNDGGIDGIIKEDKLGFSSIYIQAKQWDPARTVDRPAIDTFIGALTRNHANKGLFITTASFSSGAKTAADATNVVLVDGKQLTRLMIAHNLGVSVEHIYELKKIDSDFFEDGI